MDGSLFSKKAGNSAGAMGREKQKLKLSGKLHKRKTEMSSILQNLTDCINQQLDCFVFCLVLKECFGGKKNNFTDQDSNIA